MRALRFPEGLQGRPYVRGRKLQREGQDPRMQDREIHEGATDNEGGIQGLQSEEVK